MTGIAAIGVVVNVALAFILGEHHVHMPGHEHGNDRDHDYDHPAQGDQHDYHDQHSENVHDLEKDNQGHAHEHTHEHSHEHSVDSHTEHTGHDHSKKEHTNTSELEPLYGSIFPIEHND